MKDVKWKVGNRTNVVCSKCDGKGGYYEEKPYDYKKMVGDERRTDFRTRHIIETLDMLIRWCNSRMEAVPDGAADDREWIRLAQQKLKLEDARDQITGDA